MSPVWQEWTFVMRAGRNNTVKRRLHLLRQMVQIWQKNLVKLNTTQVRNPMADKRQIWWSTRHWLKNTARIKMSTFKNRTRAANAVGKTSRRGPVTEILLIGYNKKETTITSTGAPPTGRGRPDCWRWGGDTNLTLAHWMREEGWQRGPLPVTVWWQRVLGEGRGGEGPRRS